MWPNERVISSLTYSPSTGPLEDLAAAELVAHTAGGGVLPRDVMEYILANCAGVPLQVLSATTSTENSQCQCQRNPQGHINFCRLQRHLLPWNYS